MIKAIRKATLTSNKWPNGELISFVEKFVPLQKGEFVYIQLPSNKATAIIACPICGCKRPLRSHEIKLSNRLYTVTPSINNDNGGCCKYHGHLKDSYFTKT